MEVVRSSSSEEEEDGIVVWKVGGMRFGGFSMNWAEDGLVLAIE